MMDLHECTNNTQLIDTSFQVQSVMRTLFLFGVQIYCHKFQTLGQVFSFDLISQTVVFSQKCTGVTQPVSSGFLIQFFTEEFARILPENEYQSGIVF